MAAVFLHAQGGAPFHTDDPGTPGAGRWEINVAWIHESREGARLEELPLFDLNYGWGERVEVKYEVSHLLVKEAGAARESGLSNSLIGAKWRFYETGQKSRAMSVYPQVEFRNPGSTAARRGLVPDETTLILPVQYTQELAGGMALGIEAGCALPGKSDSGWFYGVVVGREIRPGLEAGVELHGECDRRAGRSELAVNLGMRMKVNERANILISIGRDLHNHFEPRATLIGYLGWQWLP